MEKSVRNSILVGLSMLLVLFIVICSMAIDRSKEDRNTSQLERSGISPATETNNPFTKHMDITLAIWEIGSAFQNAEQDELLKQLQDKFNITIKPVQVSWSDWGEEIKIWAASGKLPDIFATNLPDSDFPLYDSWVEQGIIRKLPEDMSKFPHLAAYLQSPDVQPFKKDGKFYAYPRYTYPTTDGWMTDKAILVRKDWMEKLGLHDPQNFEQFKDMLRAFVTQDPDGDGIADEIGLEGQGSASNYLNFIFSPTLPEYVNYYFRYEKGKWIPNYMSINYPTVLKQWRDLYQEGLLDKDFAIYKNKEGMDVFAQGRAGAFANSVNIVHIKMMSDLWEQYHPGTKFTDYVKMLPIWPSEDGNRYHYVQSTYWSESYFNAHVSDEKMERIMHLYDYLASTEGMHLLKFGRENIDYFMENGMPVSLLPDGLKLNDKYPSLDALGVLVAWAQDVDQLDIPINRKKFGNDNFQLFEDSLKWIQQNTKPIPVNMNVQTIVQLEPKKNGVSFERAADDSVKLVLGKEDIDLAWSSKLKEYEKQGLTQIVEDVNKQVQEKGVK